MNAYEKITDHLIKRITNDKRVPWQRPWRKLGHDDVYAQNLEHRKPYRGINFIMTNFAGFDSPYWLTFKQLKNLGGNVKGQKGTPVVYWNWIKKFDEETQQEKTIPFAKSYTVFNLDQIAGIDGPKPEEPEELPEHERIAKCEALCHWDKEPKYQETGNRAFYRPATDTVTVPPLNQFNSADEYYCTRFHENVHSTGHKSRLDRRLDDVQMFGDHNYSFEELVAEMGACMLCAEAGINTTEDNSVAYLQGWVDKFRDKPKMLIQAAGKAQKAVDLIMGREWEDK